MTMSAGGGCLRGNFRSSLTGLPLEKFQEMTWSVRLKSAASPHVYELFPVEVRVDKETGHRNPAEEFDSGDSTFLQRGSPPPPPWRLLPESLFFNGLTVDAGKGFSYFPRSLAGV